MANLTKELCEKAKNDGIINEASAKMSVAYMLFHQGFQLFFDANDDLEKCHLMFGHHKQLANRAYKALDDYFFDCKDMLSKEDKEDFKKDFDVLMIEIKQIVERELKGCHKRRTCEICGRSLPLEYFAKGYKCRCKECVAKARRRKRAAMKRPVIEEKLLRLDRKRMQACQIYPHTVIVPYDHAKKVIGDIINFYVNVKR